MIQKNMMTPKIPNPASFRDPSGFVYTLDGTILRQINQSYQKDYDMLMSSGLYHALTGAAQLIEHTEITPPSNASAEHYKTIAPHPIKFISYPYEWSFGQLKDAALLTLDIQKRSLQHGMCLKDASAYNIQFRGYNPVFIDTLSFEQYTEGTPWVAYRQFCQHFLLPLALMNRVDINLSKLLRTHIDGIPLALGSSILNLSTYLNIPLLLHVHMHAKSQEKYSSESLANKGRKGISRNSLLGLIDSLESAVKNMKLKNYQTQWGDYYGSTNYNEAAMLKKKEIVQQYIQEVNPSQMVDLGANKGDFSRLGSDAGIYTISSDIDPIAVEKNYQDAKQNKEDNILPLLIDLTNPSPGIGWDNKEREPWSTRAKADLALALALVHHLVISNNLPLQMLADYFSSTYKNLIIEFVPKSDSQVKRLLQNREDIFVDYNQDTFEQVFMSRFSIVSKASVQDSDRTLYLMRSKH
jgi:ribosomal protein L11 methylase PrmA